MCHLWILESFALLTSPQMQPCHRTTITVHNLRYFKVEIDVMDEMECLVQLVLRDLQEREETLEDPRAQED